MIWIVAAAGWGVAEASLFFLAPDVILTAAAVKLGFARALRLAAVAAGAAALTGIVMWLWGRHDAIGARAAMLMVPAIGLDLVIRAHREMQALWALHLFAGSVTGVAYKLYAVEAGAAGINLFLFVPLSFAARLLRFTLTTGFTALACEASARLGMTRWNFAIWGAGWTVFYAVYFTFRAFAGAP